ncbi:MFS transporter [Saccharopolyspora erythraea]|uniref:MFS transporter n=1 Tax=Saccharopolyspora erythraea TaxID=1836 RepID=UPI001BA9BA90|nr:MFS transporter [Saccharopolyspora erythraea]QUH02058.1 MFS transporter [Saccharopolyspora erythraea]
MRSAQQSGSSEADPAVVFKPQAVRRAATAGALGNLIEYYDFSLYGYLAVVIAPQFFPAGNSTTSLLAALAVFATAFLARPVGGIFFGLLGDRMGRRTALISSVVCMGVAASATGLLPTYDQIGIAAAVLLFVARLAQGFSAGGEAVGSITYVYESVPMKRRAFLGSFNYIGSNLGFAVAAVVAGAVSALTTEPQMAEWGWRVPFLLAIPLTLLCLWARLRIEDTPEFAAASRRADLPTAPMREAFATHRVAMLQTLGVTVAQTGCLFLGLTYMNIYLSANLGYDATQVHWLSALVVLAGVLLMLPAGWLAGRFGSRNVMLVGFVGLLVTTYPALMLMGQQSLALAGVAYLLYMGWGALIQSPAASLFPRLFERRVRYTGMAVGYNLGNIVAGGTAPYAAAYLIDRTGNVLSPSFFVMTVCVIGIATLLGIRKYR